MRIPIVADGFRFIIPLALVTVVFAALSMHWGTLFFGLALLFCLNFFRDPERAIPQKDNVVVSPADGKVVEIAEDTDPLLKEPMMRVSIFLNVFNVHVNRVPVAGRIEAVRYNKGSFLNAASHKASAENEQNALLIDTGREQVLMKQIAGLIARRIVCWAKEGDRYELGQRMGLIRFGSRTDLFLPRSSRIEVQVGDKVSGGSSIIGFLDPGNSS
ncbi:phosphatidylserine decarboxylase family protein [Nitrospina sp. 32_T5]|uniref:phosphatidylserine decarboxylase family protein n=1 Tax=unclassified Nitrospina TaxID=2638683 RepID=UPI003F9D0A7B